MDQGSSERAETDERDPGDLVAAVEEDQPEGFLGDVSDERRHQPGYVAGLSHRLVPGGRDAAFPNQGDPELGDAKPLNLFGIGRVNVSAFHYRVCSFLPLGGRERITTHYAVRDRAPRLGPSSPSVIDRTRRLGLKDANEMRRDELLVASEGEAVAPRNSGGDTAERRGERSHHHRVGPFLVSG